MQTAATGNDIWNYKGVSQFQTVKIFKDLRNKTNRWENARIRENLWTVEIGGLCKHIYHWALRKKRVEDSQPSQFVR